jgi:hypothetical protein
VGLGFGFGCFVKDFVRKVRFFEVDRGAGWVYRENGWEMAKCEDWMVVGAVFYKPIGHGQNAQHMNTNRKGKIKAHCDEVQKYGRQTLAAASPRL